MIPTVSRASVYRACALVAAVAVGASIFPGPGSADEKNSRKWRKADAARTYVKPSKRHRKVETMEDIDANGYDPACNYCGFPSWARSALSPKDGGGAGGRD